MFPGHPRESSVRLTQVKHLFLSALLALLLVSITLLDSFAGPGAPSRSPSPVQLPSGLSYQDQVIGTGLPVEKGRLVTVSYIGRLPDGKIFDESHRTGTPPFVFVEGVTHLLPGWSEGVIGMAPGGRRRLVLPPDLAYGTDGVRGFIPPSATLTYEIEVLKVE